jgi:hypothetical protein
MQIGRETRATRTATIIDGVVIVAVIRRGLKKWARVLRQRGTVSGLAMIKGR